MKRALWFGIASVVVVSVSPDAADPGAHVAGSPWYGWLAGWAGSHTAMAAEETAPEAPATPSTPAGMWYEVGVECPFCASFENQSLALSKDANLIRYSDRLEIASNLKSAKFTIKGQGREATDRNAKVFQQSQKTPLYIIQYVEEDEARATDTYARVWSVVSMAGGKLLYGRRYSVSAFADDAFEERGKGYRAREKFLPPDRLIANLEDVRVASLNENRKIYQPSDQVRFTLEGAVCYVREGVAETDIALAREEAKRQGQERAGRETLFRTLVQQGDQAYAAGNFDDALNRYKAASAILPEIALVHADLGAVYQVQNKLPEAESSYRLALSLDPADLDSLFNLAQLMEQTGKPAEALKMYRQVLEKRPQDTEAKERVNKLSQKLNQ